MMTVRMTGWKKGLQTISLIKAVDSYSTNSLVTAKKLVEDLLAGECVTLYFESIEKLQEFRTLAESFGAILEAGTLDSGST